MEGGMESAQLSKERNLDFLLGGRTPVDAMAFGMAKDSAAVGFGLLISGALGCTTGLCCAVLGAGLTGIAGPYYR